MAFGYRYTLERQENGWQLVRFPKVPEALTEGETEVEALSNAADALITALEGYIKAGRAIPLGDHGEQRTVLPSLVTAKLAVYCAMKDHGWTRQRLADALDMPENSVRRLLNLRHRSHMQIVDEALAKMQRQLNIELTPRAHRK
ncbi:MAG: type II toxin-antitoxin system HicB family antitoxin [Rhodomicrobium sp.]